MYTNEEMKAHQKKYPFKLGGIPMEAWFAQKALREQQERERVTAISESSRSTG